MRRFRELSLLKCIRSDNTHSVVFRKFMRYFLYVHISRFRLFGVNNADSVHGFHFSVLPFYTVSIKYENEIALAVSLIIAKNIYKHLPCTVKTAFRQFFEVFPGKNHIVSVYKQIFRAVVLRIFINFSAALSIAETAVTFRFSGAFL